MPPPPWLPLQCLGLCSNIAFLTDVGPYCLSLCLASLPSPSDSLPHWWGENGSGVWVPMSPEPLRFLPPAQPSSAFHSLLPRDLAMPQPCFCLLKQKASLSLTHSEEPRMTQEGPSALRGRAGRHTESPPCEMRFPLQNRTPSDRSLPQMWSGVRQACSGHTVWRSHCETGPV